MVYLATKLIWYIVAAFVIGIVVGWVTCTPRTDETH